MPTPSIPRRFLRPGCTSVLVTCYLLLLLVSHVLRHEPTESAVPGPGESLFIARAVDGDKELDGPVGVVYRDEGPADRPDAPVVVLLHGSPGSKEDFAKVVPLLARRYRVIRPDLPGFGHSKRDVPDFSIRAHAHYVRQLLAGLGIERAHIAGFSMGGGVALSLYDIDPVRVSSVSLISSIGVQELELLGNYRLNHFLHGLQLGGLWLLHEGFPHMGYLDDAILDVAYARNFYDTDQRPLRGVLERFEPPMYVLHGKDDFLVPKDAAVEHHRIVPQSELRMLERSHFFVFTEGAATAGYLSGFLDGVERGRALRRTDVPAERAEAARAAYDPSSAPPATGFALVFFVVAIALATLVSEDLTCIAVGLMVAQGRIDLWPGIAGCFGGILLGDLLLFAAGRFLGRPALQRAPLRWWVSERQVDRASNWFSRRGALVIVLSRFFPGTRLPTYFAAGMLKTRFWWFALYFTLAVAVWTPLLVVGSRLLGDQAGEYLEWFEKRSLLVLLLLGLWILAVVKGVLPLVSHAGRRRLVGFWRRKLKWEFWPPWIFYPPVAAYVIWLGLRHRSPLLFTAANPAIEASGFIAESKQEILDGLAGAGDRVARGTRIAPGLDPQERVRRAERFLADNGLDYPCVLKPDAGQRGSGVVIAGDADRLRRYLLEATFDTVVQEFVPGIELGIFYYRYPGDERGRILSVTEKRMPSVTGDGQRSLERLILDDPRAVCMADLYLGRQSDSLSRVPGAGESIRLVELGTHCLGAVFLDGSHLLTPQLEAAIEEISRTYRGFYFGRYDLRGPDLEAFRAGRDFKVIELNGVTSEATHIYDPRNSLLTAYRTLFRQWRIAFEIGRRNRQRGVAPVGLGRLVRLIREYRKSSRAHPG